jgi:hypothetical protein
MRSILTTVAELAGAASIVVGVTLVNVPAGWITAGVVSILFSLQAAR